MVNVVLIGGTSGSGKVIAEEISKAGEHNLTVFSRKDASWVTEKLPNVKAVTVDYSTEESIAQALHDADAHTVLSSIIFMGPQDYDTQLRILNACLATPSVKRFAPSEWGNADPSFSPVYEQKKRFRAYLEEHVPREELEWSYFIPGYFLDILGWPYEKDYDLAPAYVNAYDRKAVIVGSGDEMAAYTTVRDVGRYVNKALSLPEGKWPKIAGMGTRASWNQILAIAERLRGPFKEVHRITPEQVQNNDIPYIPTGNKSHPAFQMDINSDAYKTTMRGITQVFLIDMWKGNWDVQNTLDELMDFKPESVEEFMIRVWGDRKD